MEVFQFLEMLQVVKFQIVRFFGAIFYALFP